MIPSWDALTVIGCSVLVVAAAVLRGVQGMEPWIALVLAVNAAYLGLAWWRRN
jgi:hypothetical protein